MCIRDSVTNDLGDLCHMSGERRGRADALAVARAERASPSLTPRLKVDVAVVGPGEVRKVLAGDQTDPVIGRVGVPAYYSHHRNAVLLSERDDVEGANPVVGLAEEDEVVKIP